MDRPRVSAKRCLERGKASNYIRPIEAIQPGDLVVLACRESGRTQDRNGNLDNQEAKLRKVMARRGATVAGVVRHVGSGWDVDWLTDAVELAKPLGAKIVAESTCRLVRHPCYHSVEWKDAQARECDLRELRRVTEGVTLVTVVPPDAPPGEELGYAIRRGQEQKDRKGGRPPSPPKAGYKKLRRDELLRIVVGWHEDGWTLGQIAKITGLARSTVQDWIAKYA